MTEEQQRIYDATQEVIEATAHFVDTVRSLFNEVIKVVTDVIESVVEWYQSVCKEMKKHNCNNWRRIHGLPLIHRNKKCRQGQMFHQLL